jgi:hypothetical protein
MKMGRLLFKTAVPGYFDGERTHPFILSVDKDMGERKDKITKEVMRTRRVREE